MPATAAAVAPVPPTLVRRPSTVEERAAFEQLTSHESGNAFVNHTWRYRNPTKFASMIILGLTLLPLRLVLTFANVFVMIAIANIGTLGMRKPDFERPMAPWRRVVLYPLRPLIRLQLFIWGVVWIRVKGTLAPKSVAPIVVSNHITFLDPMAMIAMAGGTPVSAIENARLPLVGSVFIALQTMFVERDKTKAPVPGPTAAATVSSTTGQQSGAAASPAVARPAGDAIRETIRVRATDPAFPRVLIFPEGTCTNGTAVMSFKTGAFGPGVPVQPVAVRYPHAAYGGCLGRYDPSWVAGGPDLPTLLLRLLTRLYTPMEVTFLPPYTPSPEEVAHPAVYAANVQRAIAGALGVRTTQHTFEDVLLTIAARKAHYPVDHAVVEFQALRSVLNIDAKTAQAYLKRFIAADKHKTGQLNYAQFKTLFLTKGDASPTAAAASTGVGTKVPCIAASAGAASQSASGGAAAVPSGSQADDGSSAHSRGLSRSLDDVIRRSFTTELADNSTEAGGAGSDGSAVVTDAHGAVVGQEEDLQRLFSLLDVDESGSLDFRELLVGLSILNEHGANKLDEFRLAFRLLDTSGTGRITRGQLERALRRVWPDLLSSTMDAIFAEVDADHDGMISSAEFVEWAARHTEHVPLFRERLLGFGSEVEFLAVAAAESSSSSSSGGGGRRGQARKAQ